MNILNYLKSKIINPSGTLVKYTIPIPTKEIYKDNQDKLNNIEEYKNKYLKILTTKKLISSKELELDNLQSNLEMIINLLIHNLSDNDNFLYFTKSELMVKSAKLEMYLWELSKYETETILRIIALNELKENKKIPKHNKRYLNLELDNLMNNLTIYMVQKEAVFKEKDNYLNRVIINNQDDNGYVEERYKYLYELAENIIEMNKLNKLTTKESKFAYLERELEIYTYKNKSNLKELLNELKKLEIQKKTLENREKFLKIITSIEIKLLLFYEFEYINEDVLKYLYQIKFAILVSILNQKIYIYFDFASFNSGRVYFEDQLNEISKFICVFDGSLEKLDSNYKCNEIEEETYRDLLQKKLINILNDDNNILQKTFGDNKTKVIELLNKYFNNYDDFKSIIKLQLLLSLEKENGFEDLLNNVYRNVKLPPNQFITAQKFLTLKSFFELNLDASDEDNIVNIISKLYKLVSIKDKDRYYIPEGLVNYTYKAEDIYKSKRYILKNLREKSIGKKIVFPSTMRKIEGPFFKYNGISEIILNDGLEYIGTDALFFEGTSITIPSSVKMIYDAFAKRQKLFSITFDDYETSELLKDEECKKHFFNSLLIINVIENEAEVYFRVKRIILKSKNGKEYTIDLEKVQFIKEFDYDKLDLLYNFLITETEKICLEQLNEQQYPLKKALIRK